MLKQKCVLRINNYQQILIQHHHKLLKPTMTKTLQAYTNELRYDIIKDHQSYSSLRNLRNIL